MRTGGWCVPPTTMLYIRFTSPLNKFTLAICYSASSKAIFYVLNTVRQKSITLLHETLAMHFLNPFTMLLAGSAILVTAAPAPCKPFVYYISSFSLTYMVTTARFNMNKSI